MNGTQRYTPGRYSKKTGNYAGVNRWLDTWHDHGKMFTATVFVAEDGEILSEDHPRVVAFKAAETAALAEFAVVANRDGIGAALKAVPSIS